MSFTSKGLLEIVVAGWQNTMFVIDLTKGEVVKRVGLSPCGHLVLPPNSSPVGVDRSRPIITTPS